MSTQTNSGNDQLVSILPIVPTEGFCPTCLQPVVFTTDLSAGTVSSTCCGEEIYFAMVDDDKPMLDLVLSEEQADAATKELCTPLVAD